MTACKQILLGLAVAAALAGCATTPALTPAEPVAVGSRAAAAKAAALDTIYANYWEALLEFNPLQATFQGDPRYNDRLPNFLAQDYRDRSEAFTRQWLQKVEAVGPEGLSGQALLSYEIFVRDARNALEGNRFPNWMQPLNQFYNFAATAVQLGSGTSAQPFKTVKDYADWRARASKLLPLFDQAIANMRAGMASGVVQPTALMVKVQPQLDAIIQNQAQDSLFWMPIKNIPADFSEADKARITAEYETMIEGELMPAYRELRAFVADAYMPATRSTSGMAALPDGEAWYAYNARNSTTTDLTPAQIHQIGLDEVARIHGLIQTEVMDKAGFDGTLHEFFAFMQTDPQFSFDTEAELLAHYRGLEDTIMDRIPALFSLTPEADFEIRPVEPFRAQSAAGGSYMSPSEDGSRPGIFYVNTFDLPTRKTWDAEDLFLHEAIPGHHFQIALQQELTGLPDFRRFGGETAFTEGWGLYAESLGKQLGVYQDPYNYFGYLQNELWRAIRLVVDTGLHSKGWTREQVIAYMLENSAESQTQATAEAERYMAIPGQALAYKIGELKIQELRDRAEAALGDRFDIRAFHAEVLKDGSVPLDVLEAKIDRWVKQRALTR